MPEILTESFCERCGTRYTFESAAPRAAKLKGIKVLSRGLKNFVMSDDTSMDEAMAAARSETDREVTSQQLDAFHKTFNFCMSCRQYTCGNCWNEAEGRCLSCAPHLGHEILPAPFPDVRPSGTMAATDGLNGNGHAPPEPAETLAWPSMDLDRADNEPDAGPELEPIDAAARLAALGSPAIDEDAADAAAEAQAEAGEAAAEIDAKAVAVEPEAEAVAVETSEAIGVEPPTADRAATGTVDEPILDATEPDLELATAPAEVVQADIETDEVAPETVPAGSRSDLPSGAVDPAAAPETPPRPAIADAPDLSGRAAAAAAQTTDLLRRFRPGQNLDAELEAYEREQAIERQEADVAAAADIEAESVDEAPAPAASPAATAEAEPVNQGPAPAASPAAQAEPEPEPDQAPAHEPAQQPGQEPALEPPAAPAGGQPDVVQQPTWRIVAPEAGEPVAPTAPTTAPAPAWDQTQPAAASTEPQWPTTPQWPSQRPSGGLPFLDRPAQPTGGLESLWAESAREVTATPTPLSHGLAPAARPAGGVQPCVSCGLSLSATARFCRRCGTRQG